MKDKLTKSAFTLIELLGVIALLAVLGLIVIPVVTNTINNSREKAYDAQVKKIIEAAKQWSSKNNNLLPDIGSESSYNVQLSTLISSGYIGNLNDAVLSDPRDGSIMNGCVNIKYSNEYNQYVFEYNTEC